MSSYVMNDKKTFLAAVCLFLACAAVINLAGCAIRVRATEDLMEGISAGDVISPAGVEPESAGKAADFAVRLFRQSNENGKNTLVSPLSVLAVLSMTANGAAGETKAEMEKVLGMDVGELNVFFRSYMNTLGKDEKNKLSLANSIWFKADDNFSVRRDFLQTNADYYGAGAYKAPFDKSTLNDINDWVNDRTDGMIPEVLDAIPENAIMYLINALAFDAEWEEIYTKENQIREGQFTLEDGTEQTVELMHSTEAAYLEDGNATGFIKYYAGRRYAFAALLPNEGVTVSDYVGSLDGKALRDMLSSPEEVSVDVMLPKFETEYNTEMSDVLIRMGMPTAFDGSGADFSLIGSYRDANIFISRVIHKTFVSVGEKGTRAGAATVVEMAKNGGAFTEKSVILDRPFVYMLIDTETNIPFFIGTMMNPAK